MDQDKIADRIRKLLALSQSSNEHEAAAAAGRAAELMAEHQIQEAMLAEAERDPVDAHAIDSGRRAVTWKGILAVGVAYSFGCRMYWSHDLHDGARRTRVMVVGRASDVDAVRYVFAYLCNDVERLATQVWDGMDSDKDIFYSARSWKNSFRVAAAGTIAERLRQARDQSLATARSQAVETGADRSAALVRLQRDEAEVEAFVARLGLRQSPRRTTSDRSGHIAGANAGRNVNLDNARATLARPAARLPGR